MKRFILLIALLLPMLVSAQIPAIEKLGKEAKRQKGVEYESVGSFMLGMASKMAPKEQRATFEMLDHIDMIVSEDNTYLATLETRLKAIIRDLGASFIVKTDEEKTTHEVYGVKSGGVFTQLIIITKGKTKGYAVTAMSGKIPENRLGEIAKLSHPKK